MRLPAYAVHTCPKGVERQSPRRALTRLLMEWGPRACERGRRPPRILWASVRPVCGDACGASALNAYRVAIAGWSAIFERSDWPVATFPRLTSRTVPEYVSTVIRLFQNRFSSKCRKREVSFLCAWVGELLRAVLAYSDWKALLGGLDELAEAYWRKRIAVASLERMDPRRQKQKAV